MILHGKYITGIGRAHQFSEVYRPAFGCPMVATFNVRVDGHITEVRPTKQVYLTWPGEQPKLVKFWLCKINGCWAWAIRWLGSRLPETRLEFVAKSRLPDQLKEGSLAIEVFERWPDEKIQEWAKHKYQWQGFSWLPRKRVDSEKLWKIIEPQAEWPGASVLDVGSHYGYHSFQASKLGALVWAVEPDDKVRSIGGLIGQHIAMQDVQFKKAVKECPNLVDIILYLSVQHQWDPEYDHLSEKIIELLRHARKLLFVELILPPLFGKKYTTEEIDQKVGGEVLSTYRHQMRGNRRIYMIIK